MDCYRREPSNPSLDGGKVTYPFLENEGDAMRTSPLTNETCRQAVPGKLLVRRCEQIPTSSPSISAASWVLRLLSIHPTSPRFFLLSVILDLAIFYLVQAVQFTTGVALLHALYPAEPDYTMSTARSMRIGAAGGAMFVGIVVLRSLLQLGYRDPEEDMPEQWESVWDAVGCLQAKRAPDVRYVAFIGISGSVAFGRGTYDMSGLLHAATAALVGYVLISMSKGALSYARRSTVVL